MSLTLSTEARALALVVWLGVVACTSPTGSSSRLAGAWRTAPLPSGSGIDLSLTTTGQQVAGTGHQYTLQFLADTLSVRGSHKVDGTFRLDLTFGSGATATYSGRLAGRDQLDGIWTDGGQGSQPVIFYRQIQ
jgi:hypothetical protein